MKKNKNASPATSCALLTFLHAMMTLAPLSARSRAVSLPIPAARKKNQYNAAITKNRFSWLLSFMMIINLFTTAEFIKDDVY